MSLSQQNYCSVITLRWIYHKLSWQFSGCTLLKLMQLSITAMQAASVGTFPVQAPLSRHITTVRTGNALKKIQNKMGDGEGGHLRISDYTIPYYICCYFSNCFFVLFRKLLLQHWNFRDYYFGFNSFFSTRKWLYYMQRRRNYWFNIVTFTFVQSIKWKGVILIL